jgi:two-component system, response regulator PdtaR
MLPEPWRALPAASPQEPAQDARQHEESVAARPIRILIVEDEVFVAMDAEAILTSAGYDVVATAASADDAVSKAGRLLPDLVLMDVRLLGPRDGIDAALEITHKLKLPIIFVTANVDPVTHTRAMQAKPLTILSKPFTSASLLQAVGALKRT